MRKAVVFAVAAVVFAVAAVVLERNKARMISRKPVHG